MSAEQISDGQAVAAVWAYFRRCGKIDPTIVELYTEDAIFFDASGPETIVGRDRILQECFEPLFAAFPDFHCDHRVRHIVASGGVVLAELEIEGTHRGPFLGHDATGRLISWPTTGVWELSAAGLITREAYYWDRESVSSQLNR